MKQWTIEGYKKQQFHKSCEDTNKWVSYLNRTVTQYHFASITHCFFKCYSKFRAREHFKLVSNLTYDTKP